MSIHELRDQPHWSYSALQCYLTCPMKYTLEVRRDSIMTYIKENPAQAKPQAGLFDFLSKEKKAETQLDKYREAIDKESGAIFVPYRFTVPLILFASFGVIAFFIALYLKIIDKKNKYGLEEPNIKKDK